jgi:hypothetical protein
MLKIVANFFYRAVIMKLTTGAVLSIMLLVVTSEVLAAADQNEKYCPYGRHALEIHWLTNGKIEKKEAAAITEYFTQLSGKWMTQKKYIGARLSISVYAGGTRPLIFNRCLPGCPEIGSWATQLKQFISAACSPILAKKARKGFTKKLVSAVKKALRTTHRAGTNVFNQMISAAQSVPKESTKDMHRTDVIIGRILPSVYLTKDRSNRPFDAAFVRFVQDGPVIPKSAEKLSIQCTGEKSGTGAFWRDVFELYQRDVSLDCN